MIVSLDTTQGTIHKLATTDAEAERLERESAVLRVARHPGVVQLRDHQGHRLEVRAVDGWCLSDIGPMSAAEVAGVGSAIATTLADLHDLGIVHGSVEAGHVLLGSDHRPVLCSLGYGRLPLSATGPSPEDDVAALIQMLLALLRPDALEVPGVLCHRRGLAWKRAPTARHLAARLAAIPEARLPNPGPDPAEAVAAGPAAITDSAVTAGPADVAGTAGPDLIAGGVVPNPEVDPAEPVTAAPGAIAVTAGTAVVAGPSAEPDRKRWAVAGAVGLAAAVAAAFLLVPSSDRRPAPERCPTVDRGCRPIDHRDGVVATDTGQFSLGGPSSDPLVLGRWTCGPALPALLRVDRGEVWVWDRWPADGAAAAARLAGRIEGAETLRVVAGASGCDHLSVIERDGEVEAMPANLS